MVSNEAWEFISNKYTRFVIYSFALLFTNVLYAGWVSMSLFMKEANKFSWECKEIAIRPDGYLCDEQEVWFTFGFTIITLADNCFGLVAGTLFDLLGPKWCGLIGQASIHIALPIVSLANNTVGMCIGFFFLGFGSNYTFYSALSIGAEFGDKEQLVISSILAVQYGTTLVYPTLLALGHQYSKSFTDMTLYYWYFIIPFSILFIIALPTKTRKQIDEDRTKEKGGVINSEDRSVWYYLSRPEWILQAIWQAESVMVMNMYNQIMIRWSGETIAMFYSWINIISAPCTVMLGWIASKCPVSWFILQVSLANIVAHALTYGNTAAKYASTIIYSAGGSFFWTARVVYIASIFPPEYLGRLTGISSTIDGLINMVATPIVKTGWSYQQINGLSLGLLGLGAITNIVAIYLQVVKKHHYKILPGSVTPSQSFAVEEGTFSSVENGRLSSS